MKIRFTGSRIDLHHPGVGDVATVELRSYSHEDHEGLPWINGTALIRPEDETATEMHARRLRHPDGSPVWVLNYRGRGFLTDLLGSAVAFVKVSLEEDGVISSPDNEGMA